MKWFVVAFVILLSGCGSIAERAVDIYLSHPDTNYLHKEVDKCVARKECHK